MQQIKKPVLRETGFFYFYKNFCIFVETLKIWKRRKIYRLARGISKCSKILSG